MLRSAAAIALVLSAATAHGDPKFPVEHEPIPSDPANDNAFGLRLDGDLPAAIATRSGLVAAPDPRAALPADPPAPDSNSLAGHDEGPQAMSRFSPDTDTRRPDVLAYSDPFTPSTAPWKRLVAFDSVLPDYSLAVSDPRRLVLGSREKARTDGSEESFFGDMVVDLRANDVTRIPSVGPGARVVHARLGIGADDLGFELFHDGADNWFVRSAKSGRARLVVELTIPRAAFGGPFGDAAADMRFRRWGSELPLDVQHDADIVAARIGVPKATPRETIHALVDYFRGFEESNDPLPPERSVYLALALSKKGVCRHRAYAFMITATALGIRARVVMNEAHAWVEVFDGQLWKRIDLGGAGTIQDDTSEVKGPVYAPPPDPFRWPPGAKRGQDLARTSSSAVDANGDRSGASSAPSLPQSPTLAGSASAGASEARDEARPVAVVELDMTESVATRGAPVHVRGRLTGGGLPCSHAIVAVSAMNGTGAVSPLGELATDHKGAYSGTISVPKSLAVGNYELVASTPGSALCGPGVSASAR